MNADDIAASINAGDYDEGLGTLFKALFARAAETGTEFSWCITIDGDSWDRESVTFGELGLAERITSVESYADLNPVRSMDHLVALIVAHYHKVKGMKIDAAVAAADKHSASELADIISIHEVTKAPKGEAAQSETS